MLTMSLTDNGKVKDVDRKVEKDGDETLLTDNGEVEVQW